ncbi:hypothetical protein CRC_02589, partial [Cylindrospermopsis raciborskii CS-505]
MMNFTIKNALSPVKEGYTTLDIQVMEGIITQVGQNLNVILNASCKVMLV